MGKTESRDTTETKDLDPINKYTRSFTLATKSPPLFAQRRASERWKNKKRQTKIYQANAKKKRQELRF